MASRSFSQIGKNLVVMEKGHILISFSLCLGFVPDELDKLKPIG
ncbi:hypothetical protein HNR69_001667 [Histophilus somni]|nr:hypothetical protein [Histophilus somni]